MEDNIIVFKGITFHNYDFDKLLSIVNEGGYLVAPAASALTNINKDNKYHESLIKSDVAILDSGFFCILLRIFKGKKVTKYSGYLFLKNFLNLNFNKETNFFIIDPNLEESKANISYLNSKNITNIKNYIAPKYDNKIIIDNNLLEEIIKFRPRYIIINLGGGIQESLANYIKNNCDFKVSILCTGAAISFLTKKQAPINDFGDKLYLGWFMRILYNPKKFLMRTIKSISLINLFIKD
jgi:UDP-N-acetyl-D-mannosaminuronic acid transferase (WecB/TagA/CpsF family)